MHLYLVGFMGVGKTTIGKKLATLLNIPFVDVDALIEEQTEQNISDYFALHGEDAFRKIEAQILRSLKDKNPMVVSTGGGLPCYYNNMEFMHAHGYTVFLQASEKFIYSRLSIAKTNRPLLKGMNKTQLHQFIEQKLLERNPFYLQSHFKVNVPPKSTEVLIKSIAYAYLNKPHESGK